jgi:hypothetical protein
MEVDAHPRHAEIRMTVDFQYVAHRLPEFGDALKAKLAAIANVPENALRLNRLREGSIIAEFLVLPIVKPHYFAPSMALERLHEAIDHDADAKNAAELCALTGGPLEGCKVEFKNLGFVSPSVKPFKPEHRTEQQQTETQADDNYSQYVLIGVCAIAAALLAMYVVHRYRKTNNVAVEANKAYEIKVKVSMEEGTVEGKPVEEDDNTSTNCPSNSDKQSEPSLSDGFEGALAPEQGMQPSVCSMPARPRSADRGPCVGVGAGGVPCA